MKRVIPVSEGILEDNHIERLGPALGEFLWLLSRITEITPEGKGVVLGGKPVTWHAFAFRKNRKSVQRNIDRLAEEHYIEIKRAPYGLIITVNKAKKIFGQRFLQQQQFSQEMGQICPTDGTKRVHLLDKNVPSNSIYKNRDKNIDKSIIAQKNERLTIGQEKIKLYERKPVEKQTQLQRICYFLEDTLDTRIVTWPKQAKALKLILQAGYTEEQIIFTIKYLANVDEFFSEKGFDLMTVANQIANIRAMVKKEVRKTVFPQAN